MLRAMCTMEARLKKFHKGIIVATELEAVPVIF